MSLGNLHLTPLARSLTLGPEALQTCRIPGLNTPATHSPMNLWPFRTQLSSPERGVRQRGKAILLLNAFLLNLSYHPSVTHSPVLEDPRVWRSLF
jgi:hypothetical protein